MKKWYLEKALNGYKSKIEYKKGRIEHYRKEMEFTKDVIYQAQLNNMILTTEDEINLIKYFVSDLEYIGGLDNGEWDTAVEV